MDNIEILYKGIREKKECEEIILQVIGECFDVEKLGNNITITVTLTNPKNIREINSKYRNIDKETDVLSFPIFEKEEIDRLKEQKNEAILGDIIISVKRVEEQAKEYEHSFKRELAYMVVHGFYHLMGYDHIIEDDKKEMRLKEENILQKLYIID